MDKLWRVAFPMYVLPEVQADMRHLWLMLKTRLQLAGMENLPEEPEFTDPLADGHVPDDLLLLQYCGFPYVSQWREALNPLACLHYDAPHCAGKRHRSVLVARKGQEEKTLADMRGTRAAINGYDSNTGMNLLRHAVAPLAGKKAFFAAVIETGAHAESLRAVVEERADIAAIDCVTFAFLQDHLPELAAAVKLIGMTAESPALPLFTPHGITATQRDRLLQAWQAVLADSHAAPLLARLHMRGISPVSDKELGVIADYQRQAEKAGYPELV